MTKLLYIISFDGVPQLKFADAAEARKAFARLRAALPDADMALEAYRETRTLVRVERLDGENMERAAA